MFLNSTGLAQAMLADYKTAYDNLKQALQILIDCLGANGVLVHSIVAYTDQLSRQRTCGGGGLLYQLGRGLSQISS